MAPDPAIITWWKITCCLTPTQFIWRGDQNFNRPPAGTLYKSPSFPPPPPPSSPRLCLDSACPAYIYINICVCVCVCVYVTALASPHPPPPSPCRCQIPPGARRPVSLTTESCTVIRTSPLGSEGGGGKEKGVLGGSKHAVVYLNTIEKQS